MNADEQVRRKLKELEEQREAAVKQKDERYKRLDELKKASNERWKNMQTKEGMKNNPLNIFKKNLTQSKLLMTYTRNPNSNISSKKSLPGTNLVETLGGRTRRRKRRRKTKRR